MVDLIKTGIEGLDAILYGGIPDGNQIILAGGPGAGKTLLSFEFLYRNAKMGNPGVFFALEENAKAIIENAKSAFKTFTDIDDLIADGKLIINSEDPTSHLQQSSDSSSYEFGKVVSDIEGIVSSSKATRVVIDSLSLLDILINDPMAYRRSMLALITNLKRMGVTSILTSELSTPEKSKLEFRPEFFIFDGIILMYQIGEQDKRSLDVEVIKMRGNNHSFVTTPYEITPKGFKLFAAEAPKSYENLY
ncbi:MAG: ATPase domain-containing protein [Candidatus Micrarchaeia archaeon]